MVYKDFVPSFVLLAIVVFGDAPFRHIMPLTFMIIYQNGPQNMLLFLLV